MFVVEVVGRYLVVKSFPIFQARLHFLIALIEVFLFQVKLLDANRSIFLVCVYCVLKQLLLLFQKVGQLLALNAKSVEIFMWKNDGLYYATFWSR